MSVPTSPQQVDVNFNEKQNHFFFKINYDFLSLSWLWSYLFRSHNRFTVVSCMPCISCVRLVFNHFVFIVSENSTESRVQSSRANVAVPEISKRYASILSSSVWRGCFRCIRTVFKRVNNFNALFFQLIAIAWSRTRESKYGCISWTSAYSAQYVNAFDESVFLLFNQSYK